MIVFDCLYSIFFLLPEATMEKRPAAKGGEGAPKPQADAPARDVTSETNSSEQDLAQTEEFTMGKEDDAANFLLDEGEAEAAPPRAKMTSDTVAYTGEAASPPAPKAPPAKPAPAKTAAPKAAAPSPKTAAPAAKGPESPAKTGAPASGVGLAGPQKVITIGDYRLTKKLGQGGMGAVYLAHQVSLDRNVAVKMLSKELAAKPAFVQRFLREARVMAKLDHPNILRCYEVGEALGYHFLSMEFVEGGSVESWLKKLGKFSIGDSLHITLATAHALQHAHELNLIHRDIKPDNILLTKKGVVKVADLGLAKAKDDDMGITKTGTGAGTPIFMAPEQARDAKHVDGRSDIYAVGCMLYVFLTGQSPFKGETLVELIEAKEKGKFTPVRQFNDEVPERLDLIIDKVLAVKPEHRYQTCAELILELENLGLANRTLSFIAPAEGPRPATPPPPAKKVTRPQFASSTVGAGGEDEGYWYASFTASDGKAVTRKLTKEQLLGMVKNHSLNAETQVSRTLKGGYRALGTYPEFHHLVKAHQTKDKAERRAEKFKAAYAKLEKEEVRRRRWRWFHNLMLRVGGGVGLLLWLVVVVGILVGLYFLGRWGLEMLRERVDFLK
jgi:serine/threonine-protein kinase